MSKVIIAVLPDSGPQAPQIEDRSYRILIDPELTEAGKMRRRRQGLTEERHAQLVGVESGETRIMATLEYIDRAVATRGLTVVERRTITPEDIAAQRKVSDSTSDTGQN